MEPEPRHAVRLGARGVTRAFGPVVANDAYATPAFADGRIYVRTTAALYAFGS